MSFTTITLFLSCISLVTLAFYGYFTIVVSHEHHDAKGAKGRILGGSLLIGVATGAVLGCCMAYMLPTYYYVWHADADGYTKRYVVDGKWSEHCGKMFIVNNSGEACFLCAQTYGNHDISSVQEPIVMINAGETKEVKESIDGWFEPFPDRIQSKSKGKTEWRILTLEQYYEGEKGKTNRFRY